MKVCVSNVSFGFLCIGVGLSEAEVAMFVFWVEIGELMIEGKAWL